MSNGRTLRPYCLSLAQLGHEGGAHIGLRKLRCGQLNICSGQFESSGGEGERHGCSLVSYGQHVTILSGTVLNHDVDVGDWSILGSGVMLSGAVKVGRTCYLGTSCSVREGTSIGDGSLVGMGAAVTANIEANVVVAGVPAKILRSVE